MAGQYEPLQPMDFENEVKPAQLPVVAQQSTNALSQSPQDFFGVPNASAPIVPAAMKPPPVPPTIPSEDGDILQQSYQTRVIQSNDFGGGQSSMGQVGGKKIDVEPDVDITNKRAKKTSRQIVGMSISGLFFVVFLILDALVVLAILMKWHN
ncbi:hypothetical protein M3Y98_01143000 [Aphelenchoides besseyi]|nr:hypothetical protein M3Y98_01143000 [Aphelenchoides besseyi]KAI6210701.1 hypothetical protein M3Y96_00355900 [Aphelenchoides besseyi]